MPYASRAQSALIHAKAAQGVPWAQKFVRDSHGTKVPNVRHVAKKKRRKRKKRSARDLRAILGGQR